MNLATFLDTKSTRQYQLHFCTPTVNNNESENEIKETIPLTVTLKSKISRNKFNRGGCYRLNVYVPSEFLY